MRYSHYLFLLFVVSLFACQQKELSYQSDHLSVHQLSTHSFVHTSYLQTESFGKVPCNGMLTVHNGEALVFDTPVNNDVAKELIDWVENELHAKLVAVVATHFHNDCLGGLEAFHEKGIPSYASFQTIALAAKDSVTRPQNGFRDSLEISFGGTKVQNRFLGEGHTKDNVVCYFAMDKVLFGGCLIKEVGADKGYLGDANTGAWSETVKKVASQFIEAEKIIPGHGKAGGRELLDYTSNLFQKEERSKGQYEGK